MVESLPTSRTAAFDMEAEGTELHKALPHPCTPWKRPITTSAGLLRHGAILGMTLPGMTTTGGGPKGTEQDLSGKHPHALLRPTLLRTPG